MSKTLGTLQKGLDILHAFLASPEALTIRDLSTHSGIPVTSLYRFLHTLEQNHYVVRHEASGKYALGLAAFRLGAHVAKGMDLRRTVQPILKELAVKTEESAILTIRDRDKALCIDCVESDHGIRFSQKIGRAAPINVGAAGKVLLAFMPQQERDKLLRGMKFRPARPEAIQDRKALLHRLDQIRKDGYDLSRGELTDGAFGIAAPILDQSHCAVAAISVSGPKFRLVADWIPRLKNEVLAACRKASEVTGSDLVLTAL